MRIKKIFLCNLHHDPCCELICTLRFLFHFDEMLMHMLVVTPFGSLLALKDVCIVHIRMRLYPEHGVLNLDKNSRYRLNFKY